MSGMIDLALRGSDVLNDKILSSQKLRDSYREMFANARPFKHLIFEDLFSEAILDGIISDYGAVNGADWMKWDSAEEKKRGLKPNARLAPASQAYINAIHSGPFVEFLSYVTGIEGLLPDPTLKGGGLHEIPQGGKFAVHVDFNKHPVTRLDNRLVLITYLNRGWQPSYGAALELWDSEEKQCVSEVLPVFGRTILFYQSAKSWHGHPSPVNTPDGRTRRSIAAYYYTNGRDDSVTDDIHTSIFLNPKAKSGTKAVKDALKSVTPPIMFNLGKRLKGKI